MLYTVCQMSSYKLLPLQCCGTWAPFMKAAVTDMYCICSLCPKQKHYFLNHKFLNPKPYIPKLQEALDS